MIFLRSFFILAMTFPVVMLTGCKKSEQAKQKIQDVADKEEPQKSASTDPLTDEVSTLEIDFSSPYVVRAIQMDGAQSFAPTGINQSGDVSGQATMDDGHSAAIVWKNGEGVILETHKGQPAAATGIAENGWVVGWIEVQPQNRQAVVWKNGKIIRIEQSDTGAFEATDISDSGLVSGWLRRASDRPQQRTAVSWSETVGLKRYDVGYEVSQFHAVNNRGEFAGTGRSLLDMSEITAFVSGAGTMTRLGSLEINQTQPEAINDRGTVVGWSTVNRLKRGFIWREDEISDIGTCERSDSVYAMGINNDDLVVGICFNMRAIYDGKNPRLPRAFIWDQGEVTVLNNLIPVDSGWNLIRAVDINDSGMIVGNGELNGVPTGFLLIPTAMLEE